MLITPAALPAGSTFISVENFGTSAWTTTGRLVALDADGSEKLYFLKVSLYYLEWPKLYFGLGIEYFFLDWIWKD